MNRKLALEKIKEIIPQSNSERIIIPHNQMGLGFRIKNSYISEYLKNYIEEERFNEFISKANKICNNVYRDKKMEEINDYNASLKKILYIGIFFSVIGFILLMALVYGQCQQKGQGELEYCDSKGLMLLSVFFLAISGIISVSVVVIGLFTQPHFIDTDKVIQQRLQDLIVQENDIFFKERNGLIWALGQDWGWLELKVKGVR